MEIHVSDIRTLSEFQRNTKEHLKEMERSGKPGVLTVNGKAKLVVQDARAYQQLLDELNEARHLLVLRQRVEDVRAGAKGRSLDAAIEDLGRRRGKLRRRA